MPLDIFENEDFKSQDYNTKLKAVNGYIKAEVESDERFKSLSPDKQALVKERLINDNVGSKPQLERTWGEAARDTALSGFQGVAQLGKTATDLTGFLLDAPENEGSKYFESIVDDLKKAHSPAYKEKLKNQQAEIDKTDGELAKFGKTISTTVSDPALLSGALTEQLPNFLPASVAGRVAKGTAEVAKRISPNVVSRFVSPDKIATGAAVGTGMAMQGTDVASDTYNSIMKLDDKIVMQSPEFQELIKSGLTPEIAKQQLALEKAKTAGLEAAGIGGLANYVLPGGTSIDKVLAGVSPKSSIIRDTIGGGLSEVAEETGGKLASNYNVQQVNPEQQLTQGLGQTAGTALVTGATFGAGFNGANALINRNQTNQQVQPQEQPKQKTADEILATPMNDLIAEAKQSKVFGDTKAKSEAMAVDVGDINYEQMAQDNQPEMSKPQEVSQTLDNSLDIKPQQEPTPTPDYTNTLRDDAYVEKLNKMEKQAKAAGNDKAVFEIAKEKAKIQQQKSYDINAINEFEGLTKAAGMNTANVLNLKKFTNTQGVRNAVARYEQGKATARDFEVLDAIDNFMKYEGDNFRAKANQEKYKPQEEILPDDLKEQGFKQLDTGEIVDANGNLLFSKKQEDEKDLLIQHNLSEANLKYARKGNGLTVPSLAITKGENPLTGFGEITLLGDKELANPKGYAKTKVFGADIYSPRYPREVREYKSSDIRKMDKELEKYSIALQDGSISRDDDVSDLANNKAMQLKFLNEVKGINPEIPTKKNPNEEVISKFYPDEYNYSIQNKGIDWTSLYKDENFKQKVVTDLKAKFAERGKDLDPIAAYGEDGINNIARERAQTIDQIGRSQGKPDFYAMREILRNEIAKYDNEFSDYVDNFKNKYDYKSFFYDDGKKKKFDENTILKYLTSNLRGGENFNYGTGNIRAIVTPEYKTIEQIKKAKDKLVSSADFEPIKDSLNNQLLEIAGSIASKGGNPFMANDIAVEFIQDYAKRGRKAIDDYDVNVNDESLKKINEFLDLLKEMPTEYFEAKITRNVQPSEFRAAIVPDSISQDALDYLSKQGLKIKTYKSGDETDRKRAIQEATKENDLLFSQFKTKNSTTVSEAINQTKKLLGKKFDKVTKNVEFVQSANELPTFIKKQLGANEDNVVKSGGIPRGIFDPQDNKIYLIADSMKANEVQGVILHELLHRAINGIVKDGQSRLDAILGSNLKPLTDRLNQLAAQGDKTVAQAFRRVKSAGVPKANQLEETMTYLLENHTNDKNNSNALNKWISDVIQAIKDFIRKVAVNYGIDPNWFISRMNASDIATVLRDTAINGKDNLTKGNILASKKTRLEEWHKDSSPLTKNADGTPKVFYHGTSAVFDTFEIKKAQDKEGRKRGLGWGKDKFYFADSGEAASVAAEYAQIQGKGKNPNVMPVYLNIKKPIAADEYMNKVNNLTEQIGNRDKAISAIDKELKKQGYDGIVDEVSGGYAVFNNTQIKSVNNQGTFDETNPNILYSKEAVKEREKTRLENIKKWVSDKTYDITSTKGIAALLYATTRQQKTDMFKDIAPELQTYDDLVEAKLIEANKIAKVSGDIAEKTRKWAVKNKAEADRLFKFMGETTIEGIDPTKSFEEQKQKAEKFYTYADKVAIEYDKKQREALNQDRYDYIATKWEALSPEAKDIYKTMKEHYERLADKMFIALKAKIVSSTIDEKSKAKLIDKLRVEFESSKVSGPYFPLMRFGEYVVSAKDKDNQLVVERYETPSERDNRANEMEQDGFSDIKKSADVDKNINLQADTAFMSDVLKEIEDSNPTAFNAISDDIYQLYLKYLPNLSARKAFIHRKGIQGYSDDMLRVFASKTFHLGRQIANVTYLDKMQEEISKLEKRVKETGDPKLKAIYEDLLKTHDHIVNPQFNELAQNLTSLGFFWYMTSLSAGLLNFTQIAMVVYPKLSGKYGVGKAFFHLNKSIKDLVTNNLTPDEKKFMEEMKDAGIVDLTMTHDLAGLGDHYNDIKYGPLTTVKRVLSIPQHYSEVGNRMVTLLTSYRLARQNKESNHGKVAIAINYETNFNYTNENRSRWMRGPIQKVAFQFKNYSVQMLYFMLKNTFKALQGDKQALKTMGTLMVVATAIAGVKGLPIQVLYALAGLGGVDDPEDELYAKIKELFGEYSDVVWRGVLNNITGADIGGRTGLGDMLLKSPTKEMNTKDTMNHYVTQILGPSLSIFTNFALGLESLAKGDYQQSSEKLFPKPIKDIVQSIRFAKEGARDNDFKPIVEDFKATELATKSIGFQPERLAAQQESNMRQMRAKQRIDNERAEILKTLRKADFKQDKELWTKTMDKIREFNTKYPSLQIKNDTISKSILNSRKGIDKAEGGLDLSPKYKYETERYK